MAAKGRTTTPRGRRTSPTRKRAQWTLQRRLRQALGYVDWPDVAVSLLLSVAADALGGRAAMQDLIRLLAALLGM